MAEAAVHPLDVALDHMSKTSVWWVLSLFLVTSTPGIFNSMHLTAYVYLAGSPEHWCTVPILEDANWSREEIHNISTMGHINDNCHIYDWNYKSLSSMSYVEAKSWALKQLSNNSSPGIVPCQSFRYSEKTPHETVVSEWDLVCENTHLKYGVQVAVVSGKFAGAFVFGFLADRIGRKKCFIGSVLLYVLAGPTAAFMTSFYLFAACRFLLGIAGSGVYETGYTILTEMTVNRNRALFGCLYNISYPLGLVILAAVGYLSPNWQTLQFVMTVPCFLLLINCWLIRESPRWLYSQGRIEEAWTIIEEKCPNEMERLNVRPKEPLLPRHENKTLSTDSRPSNSASSTVSIGLNRQKIIKYLKKIFLLFTEPELCKRVFISYYCWFVVSLTYFALALNGVNFGSDPYWYIALNGIAEAPGYILPVLIMAYFGRKATSSGLILVAGISLAVITFVPKDYVTLITVIAMIGRFCMSGVFAVIILHTSELFPTSIRNTAIGTSLTMAQLGGIVAPYIVEGLGAYAWYAPSTLCGIGAILGAFLISLLPETKNQVLIDTMEDLQESMENPRSRVSFKNIIFCS